MTHSSRGGDLTACTSSNKIRCGVGKNKFRDLNEGDKTFPGDTLLQNMRSLVSNFPLDHLEVWGTFCSWAASYHILCCLGHFEESPVVSWRPTALVSSGAVNFRVSRMVLSTEWSCSEMV